MVENKRHGGFGPPRAALRGVPSLDYQRVRVWQNKCIREGRVQLGLKGGWQ